MLNKSTIGLIQIYKNKQNVNMVRPGRTILNAVTYYALEYLRLLYNWLSNEITEKVSRSSVRALPLLTCNLTTFACGSWSLVTN